MKEKVLEDIFFYSREDAEELAADHPCRAVLLRMLEKQSFHYTQIYKWKDCLVGTINLHPRSSRFANSFECPYYLDQERCVFFIEEEGRKYAKSLFLGFKVEHITTVKAWFCRLLEEMLSHDMEHMQEVEEACYRLEEHMMGTASEYVVPTKDIVTYRKYLLERSFYYQQMADLCDILSSNEYDFFDAACAGQLKDIGKRADRLYAYVQTLRDYLVQIWELYEQQIDVQQNKTMRILTVVTTIFLPLTLIAGWYGMNFEFMPELHNPYGYWVTLGAALFIAIGEITYFRKKNYF